jgi:tRNA(Ile)-lysidine synthase
MNFFRGTGLHGLTGIPVSYGHIKRPLLDFSKEELLQYAGENNLSFMEDSSNSSSKYTRNFFRNEILPAVRKVYPMVNDNLQDNISRFKEIEKLYQLSVQQVKKKLVRERGSEWHIPVKQLMEYKNRALIYEIISGFGFREKQIDEVIKLAGSDSGHYIVSPVMNYRIIKHRHWFIISPAAPASSAHIIIEKDDKSIGYEQGILRLEKILPVQPVASKQSAFLDSKEIIFPLLLRKWKTGDYFYPLGMKNFPAGRQGKKKLSRFFNDEKLSKTQKENAWVIESNKRIIWVVGHRIDERFRVTDNTKEILKITLES